MWYSRGLYQKDKMRHYIRNKRECASFDLKRDDANISPPFHSRALGKRTGNTSAEWCFRGGLPSRCFQHKQKQTLSVYAQQTWMCYSTPTACIKIKLRLYTRNRCRYFTPSGLNRKNKMRFSILNICGSYSANYNQLESKLEWSVKLSTWRAMLACSEICLS